MASIPSKEYWVARAKERQAFLQTYELVAEKVQRTQYKQLLSFYGEEVSSFYGLYGSNKGGKIVVTYNDATKALSPSKADSFRNRVKNTAVPRGDSELSLRKRRLEQKKIITRLDKLDYNMDLATSRTKAAELKALQTLLPLEMKESYYLTINQVQNGLRGSLKFGKLSERRITAALNNPWSGRQFSDRIWTNKDLLTTSLKEITTRGFIEGKSYKTMAKDLADRTGVELWKAERLIRTEGAYITEQGTGDAYEAIGLEEYEYLAVLDQRTSELDRDIDGNVYKVKDKVVGVNWAPLHPYCRGTSAPVFDGAKLELNTENWRPKSYEDFRAGAVGSGLEVKRTGNRAPQLSDAGRKALQEDLNTALF